MRPLWARFKVQEIFSGSEPSCKLQEFTKLPSAIELEGIRKGISPGENLNIQPKIGLHAHPTRRTRHRFRCDRENLSHLDIGDSLLAVGYSISIKAWLAGKHPPGSLWGGQNARAPKGENFHGPIFK